MFRNGRQYSRDGQFLAKKKPLVRVANGHAAMQEIPRQVFFCQTHKQNSEVLLREASNR